jgi:hypothetical protein
MLPRRSARPLAPAAPAVLVALALAASAQAAQAASIAVSYPESVAAGPLDGRVLVLLSTTEDDEPRFQVGAGEDAIQIFGVDVASLAPGTAVPVGADATGDRPVGDRPAAYGYPYLTLDDVPPGRYRVQAVLHRYETFHRADGHVVKLPMDRGEGQRWNRAPGNLYSEPRWIELPADGAAEIVLDREIPPIEPPADTEHVKHIRIRSELLSEFWGRDMYLGAHVLLPEGWGEHPDERYPLMVFHGHFPADLGGFRTEPPDPALECQDSARFGVACYNRIVQQEAYDFYRQWTSPGFPRFLVVEIQHANPYYDDSYAVNSANLGPYGDAINHELIPEIERRFRGLGAGWSRFLYGGSTGGWEALAVQVFYPDEFNGAFAACPDPVDFRAYTTVDLYGDGNAYRGGGPFRKVDRPAHRDWLGHVQATVEDYNHMELALGSRGRSGDQFDIWEAVYSPVADDGYPARVWDKVTGEIDPEVAAHWREHYDLSHILERYWEELGR